MLSPTIEKASSGVHSAVTNKKGKKDHGKSQYKYGWLKFCRQNILKILPFLVGFDIAKIAGLAEVEPLRASNT